MHHWMMWTLSKERRRQIEVVQRGDIGIWPEVDAETLNWRGSPEWPADSPVARIPQEIARGSTDFGRHAATVHIYHRAQRRDPRGVGSVRETDPRVDDVGCRGTSRS